MKFRISKNWSSVLGGALLLATFVLPAVAQREQKRDKVSPEQEQLYVISAKAGGINHVTGPVRVTRDATQQTQILAKGDELGDKDRVSVGENGRIEILLNPGSFLRLAENTDLELTDTSLESLKLKLASGSALFEATAVGGEDGADISIATPQANIQLEKSGIYRINTDINATEIYVWKGAARVGNQIIKSNRKIVVGKNGVMSEIAKFDKDDSRDALDLWSKDRAKELAKTNNRLQNRELARAFSNSSLFGFSGRSSFGAGYWVFDRFTRGYCFVPYGFGYWDSPYGFGYGNGIFYDRRPIIIIRQPTGYGDPSESKSGRITPTVVAPPPAKVRIRN
ncbi:MAG: FecR family protein [Pyrinomonadaceae bacterium]